MRPAAPLCSRSPGASPHGPVSFLRRGRSASARLGAAMEFNWPAVATVTVPVITYALGAWSERRGTRLVSYYSHVAGINGAWPNGQQVHVNTHTVVLRNAGRRMATNV